MTTKFTEGGPVKTCKRCTAYFSRFSCGASTVGECDCPRCQGSCTCSYELERKKAIAVANSLPVETLTIEQAAALLPIKPEWRTK